MKKTQEVRYPNSVNLFQFCRKILDHRYGGARVIDQDVGSILGFDPADCSHWKKGKKNVRTVTAMKSIAQQLGVDERLVTEVASGELNDTEAFYEFTGYGAFELDTKVLELGKKEFFKKFASGWSKEKELEFKKYFDPNEELIDNVVKDVLTRINFEEAPLYIPEIIGAFPEIKLLAREFSLSELEANPVVTQRHGRDYTIQYPQGMETRPYIRYRFARALSSYFLEPHRANIKQTLGEFAGHVMEVQDNIFASKLITPAFLIRKEMAKLSPVKDIITQLAETFWVSKTFMNRRLKEVLENQPQI